MKRFYSLILALSLLASLTTPCIASANPTELIVDGGFENATVGTKFASSSNNTGVFFAFNSAEAVVTTEHPSSGAHAVRLTPSSTTQYPSINQRVALSAGVTYTATADIYVGDTYGSTQQDSSYIRLTELADSTDNTNAWNARGTGSLSSSRDGYITLKTIFTPTLDSPKARLNISLPIGYYCYVDNVSVVETLSLITDPDPVINTTPIAQEATPSATACPSNINEAYYLLDEDFSMLKAQDSDPFERFGWDILENSNPENTDFITYNSENFYLNDTSTTARTVLRRTFEKQSVDMSAEFKIVKMTSITDGCGVALYNGSTPVISIETKDNKLCANDTSLTSAIANETYGIRLDLNLPAQTADVYVNGALRGSAIALNGSAVDNIRLYTSVSGTLSLDVSPVRIMRGYYVADEFVPYKRSQTLPNGYWTPIGIDPVIEKYYSTPGADLYSLKLSDTGSVVNTGIKRTLSKELSSEAVLTFKAYSATNINAFYATLGNLIAKIEGNTLYIYNAYTGAYQMVSNLPVGIWNTYKLTANFYTGYANVQINGKEVASNIKFSRAKATATELKLQTGVATTDEILLDDIYVYATTPTPSDYPTEPAKLNKDFSTDIMVGMQTCDLWHEGKHFGWDKLLDYPSRRPYLGYYDDGSPEVADWEIKYMVEHGVDYAIRCWYRPAGVGVPIKEPRNSYALHDGYFNAKYKDKIKFAIAFENAGWTKSDTVDEDGMLADFKNNIVPFWFAYYFTDPNYLVIDNKPVLNIYQVSTLINNLGEANTTEAISYLRSTARSYGFDGVYLIGTTSATTASALEQYAATATMLYTRIAMAPP